MLRHASSLIHAQTVDRCAAHFLLRSDPIHNHVQRIGLIARQVGGQIQRVCIVECARLPRTRRLEAIARLRVERCPHFAAQSSCRRSATA